MSGFGFFDQRERLFPSARKTSTATPPGEPLTVGQLTRLVEKVVRAGLPGAVAVRGEVSNYSHNVQSGNTFFTLKDSADQVNCVMYRDDFERLQFVPGDGMEVVAGGAVKVFGARGRYQLYATEMSPVGQGALELAFRQLRAKLEAEGLFDPAGRKPIPNYPERIVLVTSRQTMAVLDMVKSLKLVPHLKLMLYHVPVQGDGCGRTIGEAIRSVNAGAARLGGVDLILLGRGGGSLEDLWGFNDESLARAVRSSKIPVVTGIGHDGDVSIADLAADHHAHTPTQAATVAIAHWVTVKPLLDQTALGLSRRMRDAVADGRLRIAAIGRHEVLRRPTDFVAGRRALLDDRERGLSVAASRSIERLRSRMQHRSDQLGRFAPHEQLARCRDRLDRLLAGLSGRMAKAARRSTDDLSTLEARLGTLHPAGAVKFHDDRLNARSDRLTRAANELLARRSDGVAGLSSRLELLNPQRTLERGYTITSDETGKVVRSAAGALAATRLVTRFADGNVTSVGVDPKAE